MSFSIEAKLATLTDAFGRDGYVVIDEFFQKGELDDFEMAFQRLREVETVGEKYDIAAQLPAFLRLVAKRETEAVANVLLGRSVRAPLYAFTNRCRIDPPGDDSRTYGWHQEVFYTIPGSRFVQTWAPLIGDSTIENGTIEVCVGSHRAGIVRSSWDEPAGRAAQILVDDREVAKYEQRALPMRLGQMMFFDARLFHRSGKNVSARPRYTLVGMYHDVDAPEFRAPAPQFKWRGRTPRDWYQETMEQEWLPR